GRAGTGLGDAVGGDAEHLVGDDRGEDVTGLLPASLGGVDLGGVGVQARLGQVRGEVVAGDERQDPGGGEEQPVLVGGGAEQQVDVASGPRGDRLGGPLRQQAAVDHGGEGQQHAAARDPLAPHRRVGGALDFLGDLLL